MITAVVRPTALSEIELLAGVLTEVGLQECGRFGHRDANVGQILHLRAEVHSLAVKDVPAAGAIVGHEVHVPSGDVDGSRIEWCPEPDGGAADIGERELRLMRGRIDQGHASRRLAEGAGPNVGETPVDTHGEEQVPGIPPAIELGGQVGERLHAIDGELAFRVELRDHGKRRPGVVHGFAHAAVTKHLVEVTVERQHLAVETIKGAQTEGAMSLQLANGDHAAIDAFHQRSRCGDLKQRRMVDLQGVGQRGHDDVRYRLAGLPASCLECPHEGFGDVACQRWHDGTAPPVETDVRDESTVHET